MLRCKHFESQILTDAFCVKLLLYIEKKLEIRYFEINRFWVKKSIKDLSDLDPSTLVTYYPKGKEL